MMMSTLQFCRIRRIQPENETSHQVEVAEIILVRDDGKYFEEGKEVIEA